MKNLLTAIEQANKLAQLFGLQFFAYVSDGEQKENLSSNLVLSDLETVVGGLREWQTGPVPEPTKASVLVLEMVGCGTAAYHYFNALRDPSSIYYWYVNEGCMTPNEMLTGVMTGCTGRWFIQNINLPKK